MDYLNENEHVSLRKFYNIINEAEMNMIASGKYTEAEITDLRRKLISLQFATQKYLKMQEECPELYQDYNGAEIWEPADLIGEELLGICEYLTNREVGEYALDEIDLLTTAALAKFAKETALEAGVDDVKDRVIKSTAEAVEDVCIKALNDKTNSFIDEDSGEIKAGAILNRYPEIIKIMKDRVTQKLFKNDVARDKLNPYNFKLGNEMVEGIVMISIDENVADDLLMEVQKPFSYYDWAVMEAVTSLYLYGINTQKDINGVVVLDIKSIDKVLKHNKNARTDATTPEELMEKPIYKSLRKLMANYISIAEDGNEFAGFMLDAEFAKSEDGKLCLVVNKKPVLYDYADTIGHNHVGEIQMSELNLSKGMKYTEEKIAIYRYLMQRVLEIYGTLKTDDEIDGKVNKQPRTTNSIPFSNIVKALYPLGLGHLGDVPRKEKRLLESVRDVLEAMKRKDFFTEFREKPSKDGKGSFELIRK